MAIANIRQQFRDYISNEVKNLKGGFFIPEDSITYIKFSSATTSLKEAFKKGTKAILLTHDPSLDALYNTDAKWTTAIRRVSKNLTKTGYLTGTSGTNIRRKSVIFKIEKDTAKKYTIKGTGSTKKVQMNPGVYKEKLSDSIIELAVVASTSTGGVGGFPTDSAKIIFQLIKDKIWDEWVTAVRKAEEKEGRGQPKIGLADDVTRKGRQRATKGKGGVTQYGGVGKDKRFGTLLSSNVKRAHTAPVTAEIALRKISESSPQMTLGGLTIQPLKLSNYVRRKLNITFSRQRKKVRGTLNQINLINISAKENLGDRRDLKPIVDAAGDYLTAQIKKAVKREKADFKKTKKGTLFPVLQGLTEKQSKPFIEDAVDEAILDITKNLTKPSRKKGIKVRAKIKAKRTKPLSDKNVSVFDGRRETKQDKSKNLAVRLAGVSVAKQATASNRPRNAAGRRQDEEMSMPKLKRLINRSLGAEVRRNMGRPALINRTGVFSNSVTLDTLRQGPNTIIGNYSYQTNPYQTFENTGRRQWPNGYNPKPLIARSIRNIAARHVQAKFTLRRV